jgi:hypothetical protein
MTFRHYFDGLKASSHRDNSARDANRFAPLPYRAMSDADLFETRISRWWRRMRGGLGIRAEVVVGAINPQERGGAIS